MNLRNIMLALVFSVISGAVFALDCDEVRVNTLGPAKENTYSTSAEFKCIENDFNAASVDFYEVIKNKLLSNLDVVGSPIVYENEKVAKFDFIGKNKNSARCVISKDSGNVSFNVKLSLDKVSSTIEISMSNLGAASTTGGELKELYLLTEIHMKDGKYNRSDKIYSLVEIKGVAKEFPASVRRKLDKTFEVFSHCLKAEIVKE